MAQPQQIGRDHIWSDTLCDDCEKEPIVGSRFKCFNCKNYDLCESCYQHHDESHEHAEHMFVKLVNPYEDGVMLPPRKTSTHTDELGIREWYTRRVRAHKGFSCDGCAKHDFFGPQYRCIKCSSFMFCLLCYYTADHDQSHAFVRIDWPRGCEKLLFSKGTASEESGLQQYIQAEKDDFNKDAYAKHRCRCDSCREMIESTRYQSVQNSEVDLCAKCYHSNKGSLSDEFYAHDYFRYSSEPSTQMIYPARGKGPEAARAAELSQPAEHAHESCSVCYVCPIVGIRYRCSVCAVSLCTVCYKDEMHAASGHAMWAMVRPHEAGTLLPARPITAKCLQVNYFGEAHGERYERSCKTCKHEGIIGPLYCDEWSNLCKHCYNRGVGYMDREFSMQWEPEGEKVVLKARNEAGGIAEWRLNAELNAMECGQSEPEKDLKRHENEYCKGCKDNGMAGKLYSCMNCSWDLCDECFNRGEHAVGHGFVRIDRPFSGEVFAGLRDGCDGHLAKEPESTLDAIRRIGDEVNEIMIDSNRSYLTAMYGHGRCWL